MLEENIKRIEIKSTNFSFGFYNNINNLYYFDRIHNWNKQIKTVDAFGKIWSFVYGTIPELYRYFHEMMDKLIESAHEGSKLTP